MIKPILYSDCDGVLYDTIDTAFLIMRENGVDMNNKQEIDYFFRHRLDWDYVFKKAEIINGAIDKLKTLKEMGYFSDVIILTRLSGNKNEEQIKKDIFGIALPNTKLITLEFELSKAEVVDARGNVLVDDEMKNIMPWKNANGCAILFKKDAYDLENDIVNDLLDIPNTKSVKRILKVR